MRMANAGISAALLAGAVLLGGCGRTVYTRTATWPDGKLRASESYYLDSSGRRVLHGPSTHWDAEATEVAAGHWRHGKAWDGVCWIPAAGDAGSWGGLGGFRRYEHGKFIEDVEGRR